MNMDLPVIVGAHHLEKSCRRRVFHHDDGVPPGPVDIADDKLRSGSGIANPRSNAFEVRCHRLAVLQVALLTAGLAELQQVDHQYRGVGRPSGQRGELFGGWLEDGFCRHPRKITLERLPRRAR